MKFEKTLFLLLIFFLKNVQSFGQDLIVHKNGVKIYCKILKEDSVLIVYKKPHQQEQLEIRKTEVEKYYISTATSLKNANKDKKEAELFILSFCGGRSNPFGKFGSKSLKDVESGLAEVGNVFQPSLVLKLADNFGFSASYLYQTNNFDDQIIRNQLNIDFPGGNFVTKSSDWKIRGLFGGIHLHFPVKTIEGFSVYVDLKGGLPQCTMPMVQTTGRPYGPIVTVTQTEAIDKSLAFLGGIGFRYKFHKNFALNLNVQTLYTKPFFSNILTYSTTGYAAFDEYEQKINSLNIEAGMSFIIYHKAKINN